MNATRIRRGGASKFTIKSKAQTPARGRARSRPQGFGARLIAALPVREATVQRIAMVASITLIAGAVWAVAVFFGLPGMVWQEITLLAARAGFQVEKVEVHGTQRMDDQQVYALALGQVDRSMLNLDLPKLRGELMRLSWVKDARISRRLPDTLVVDIVEREPIAVWQHEGVLTLVDGNGIPLEHITAAALPDLPLVVGPHANSQTAKLTRLMEAAPSLKPVLASASWVGNRRWDLRFQSGETLSLPEGDEEAASALVNFTRMDGANRLLGRGILRFDMRDPDKMVLRMPPDAMKADPASDSSSETGHGEDDKSVNADVVLTQRGDA